MNLIQLIQNSLKAISMKQFLNFLILQRIIQIISKIILKEIIVYFSFKIKNY